MERKLSYGTRILFTGSLVLNSACTVAKTPDIQTAIAKETLKSEFLTKPPTTLPSVTSTPEPTATKTPNILETQKTQWRDLENAERGDLFELIEPSMTRIIRFPWLGGDGYWVEINDGVTAFQSNCIVEALEESGELGEQVEDGIWEPDTKIDVVRGEVKFSSNVAGSLLEPLGIKTPLLDLTEIENGGKLYDCDVTTLDEKGEASLRNLFEAAKPQLEKVYPRLKQLSRIFGNLLDLLDKEVEEKLTPTP